MSQSDYILALGDGEGPLDIDGEHLLEAEVDGKGPALDRGLVLVGPVAMALELAALDLL